MQRIVCDVGVVISGLLSRRGAPAELLDLWREGFFDVVISAQWIAEFDRVVARPKIARYIDDDDAVELRNAFLRQGLLFGDPPGAVGLTPDPGDDYLVALARVSGAGVLVCGDRHLLGLVEARPPVVTPRAFLDRLPPRSGV